MKKTARKLLVWFLIGIVAISCSGCITGTIYGKALEPTREIDQSQGIYFSTLIIEAMQHDSLDEINQLGYHYGKDDAETFEAFWDTWKTLEPKYGMPKATNLAESYEYGTELVFVFLVEMEQGELYLSSMFTTDFDLVMLFLYETPEAALADTVMPEGIQEIDVVIGEGTEHPLSGKLTLPESAAAGDDLPAVVLVGTDGASNMNLQNRSIYAYRDLAWGLAQQGIVSIRYDKRLLTYQDEFGSADTAANCQTVAWEYIDDAVLATEILRSQECVDPKRVYYAGHGQGAIVGPRADEAGGDYAGYIMLSTSPRPWYEVIYDQYINYGLVDQEQGAIYYLVSKLDSEVDSLRDQDYLDMSEEDLVETYPLGRSNAFWKDYLSYDYVGALKKEAKPTLILQGSTSFQITEKVDFAAWQKEVGNESWAKLKSYEGLSHFFTPSQGVFAGHYKEYEMPARFSQDVIDDISSFILTGQIKGE